MTENVSRAAIHEDGQGLVELIVALTVLAIGIGSLLTLLTSSALSLQRSDQKGTALVLAEKQIELYRSVGYRDVRLDDTLVGAIPGSDPYMTANSSDSTIPSGAPSGQVLDTASDTNPCLPTSPLHPTPDNPNSLPDECRPIQTVTGPDHRLYRVHTYISAVKPNGGDTVELVTVVVRNARVASLPILARSATSFSSVNVANVNGKAIVKLSFSAPRATITGSSVAASSISATLSNTSSATGTLNFYVLPAPATPSSPCTGSSWQSLGPANVTGNGTYHPSGGYTPPAAGTYYWYASYSGDSLNKKASSICGLSMLHMTVQATKWSPALALSTTAATAVNNVAIPGSTLTAALTSSSGSTTGAITYMVYGPSASAPATCQTSVSGLWRQIGTVTPDGDGSYNPRVGFTPTSIGTYWYYAAFAADATNNGATSPCSSTMAKTTVIVPPDTFGISNIASQNAGTAFTVGTITAQLWSGGTDTSYTGSKTLLFTGPGMSATGNAPTYPATVTFTNGIATNVPITLYRAETTTLTATQGSITGTSNSFTVAGRSTAAFTIDPVGVQTAGTAFGATVRAIDQYGNASAYSGVKSVTCTNPGGGSSPNGTAPYLTAATATSLTFSNVSGQGVAVATGLNLYLATSGSALKVNETATGYNGTSTNFTVKAAAPNTIAFINCTQPTSANTTCSGSPFSTGNNGTLQANVALNDTYGNLAAATSALTINVTSASTSDYTVSPSPSVSIAVGASQSNQLTVTPAKNNPGLTLITAHATSGGFSDVTVQVQK